MASLVSFRPISAKKSSLLASRSRSAILRYRLHRFPSTYVALVALHVFTPAPLAQYDDRTHKYAMALYDYTATCDADLCFAAGDVLLVLHEESTGWWTGVDVRTKTSGLFPATFVRVLADDDVAQAWHYYHGANRAQPLLVFVLSAMLCTFPTQMTMRKSFTSII